MRFAESSFLRRVARMFAPIATVSPFFLPRTQSGVASGVDTGRSAAVSRAGWLDWVDQWYWRQRRRALEAHLAGATNVTDLEARLREIGRGFPSPYY